nr:MAG TPA: baseplate wedge protein [Caudoviricetes sp.]
MMKTINSIQAFINDKPIISTDYATMSFTEERERIQFAVGNIVTDDYYPELKAKCVRVHLSDDDIMKYKYRPKMLAYDIYDNTELYYVILRVNDLYNVKDFNLSKKYIYLPSKKVLKEFLADVHNFDIRNIRTFNSNHELKR